MTTSYDASPTGAPSLDLDVHVRRPDFALDVTLEATAGEIVGVLGPNGSGKSTLLDAVAGFVPLVEGHIIVGGSPWDDGTHHVSPRDRRIGRMTASGDLFPHLDAVENAAFGLRSRGMPKRAARERARAELAAVGLAGFERRRPSTLSSGQAQRVALARALALDPAVLLLDEPLSAVDAGGREELRALLAGRLRETSAVTLLVTHDPIEALTLADRLVVLEAGQVTQIGTPQDVVRRPRSTFASRLVGLNVWQGDIEGATLTTPAGHRIIAAAAPEASDPSPTGTRRRGYAAFAPQSVSLWNERPEGSPRNTWRVSVDGLEHVGTRVRVHLVGGADLIAEVTLDAVADLGLQQGRTVHATVKATDVTLYR